VQGSRGGATWRKLLQNATVSLGNGVAGATLIRAEPLVGTEHIRAFPAPRLHFGFQQFDFPLSEKQRALTK
jgi:hypothetical protein